jgi:hypothetical protein
LCPGLSGWGACTFAAAASVAKAKFTIFLFFYQSKSKNLRKIGINGVLSSIIRIETTLTKGVKNGKKP